MSLVTRILRRFPVRTLITAACYLGIVSLLIMMWSVIDTTALPVVLGMSVGQGIGVLAFLCFLLAILGDTQKASEEPRSKERSDE